MAGQGSPSAASIAFVWATEAPPHRPGNANEGGFHALPSLTIKAKARKTIPSMSHRTRTTP